MRIVRFNLELEAITPLICSGANKNSPKLPLSEIKAMMRFWYRAIREAKDRDALKAEEGLLFKRPVGAAGTGVSQGAVKISNHPELDPKNIDRYNILLHKEFKY